MALQRASRADATTMRSRIFGPANQISYEVDQKAKRDALKKQLADQHAAAYAAGRKKASREAKGSTGLNAGTIGGSRGALLSTFMGR